MSTRNLQIYLVILLRLFLVITIFEGLAVLFLLFRVPSDVDNAFIAGYSLTRVLMGGLLFFAVLLFTVLLFRLRKIDINRSGLLQRLIGWLRIDKVYLVLQTTLTVFLVGLLAGVFFYLLPESQRLFPMVNGFTLFQPLGERAWALMTWLCLIIYKVMILLAINISKNGSDRLGFQRKLAIVFWTLAALFGLAFAASKLLHQFGTAKNIQILALAMLGLALWFSFWTFLAAKSKWAARNTLLFESISIWLIVFLMSIQVAMWLSVLYTPDGNSFNQLADAFLHGRIYLENPVQTGDLTLFDGKWYVPFPPFPAILTLPFVAIVGVTTFNTTVFSIALASFTAVFIYLLFVEMSRVGWIVLSRRGMVWLTLLFAFGTAYWWLSLSSLAPYFSQVVTVFCLSLAFLSAVRRYPPWLTGFFLVGAILSRPNTFTLWPALMAVEMQLQQAQDEKPDWKKVIRWGVISAIPIIAGAGGQLFYNHARFGSFTDFGYVTVNASDYILNKVQKFGIFSPQYAPFNLYWMFVGFSGDWIAKCSYYFPRGNGMSFLVTTPAFLYILRRVKINLWESGAWLSIFLTIGMLLMYHNNGAVQITYRYVMDFAVPMMMLIAANAGKKVSPLLKGLIAASILINYYCIISFFRGPC